MNKWLYNRTLRERCTRNDLIYEFLKNTIKSEWGWVTFHEMHLRCILYLGKQGWGHTDLYDIQVSVMNMFSKLVRDNIMDSRHEPGESFYRKKP